MFSPVTVLRFSRRKRTGYIDSATHSGFKFQEEREKREIRERERDRERDTKDDGYSYYNRTTTSYHEIL